METHKPDEKEFIIISIDKLYLLVKEMKELKHLIPQDSEIPLLIRKYRLKNEIELIDNIISNKHNWLEKKLDKILYAKRRIAIGEEIKKELKEDIL